MSILKPRNPRKSLAVGLAVLGVAGLSVASAAQLTLAGNDADLVQAGVDDLNATSARPARST